MRPTLTALDPHRGLPTAEKRYIFRKLLVGNLWMSTQPRRWHFSGGTVGHYKSNVRDQVFNLFEVFGLDKALGQGAFSDLDVDTATEMLGKPPGCARDR